ncbi:MAG: FAD-dependent oxidoreductase [Candidatus Heimdallarchaeota archaeon]|nr:FAD-dependent oxidoreductase [Candidatus Heimdallarchaeota archaeon]
MFQRPTTPDINTEYLVIGAGVAGITLAQKLKEKGLEVWLLGSAYESQIAKAGALKNITSIPEGTIGLDHIEDMINKAKEAGVKHKTSLCTGIETNDEIVVKTKHQKFIANKVIIATGAKQPRLDFKGEEDYYHKGISDCAVCDWGLFRGKDVAIVGNHEYTRRAAEFMKQHAGQVSLLWLSEKPDFQLEGVDIFANVNEMIAEGSDVLEKIQFESDQGKQSISVSGLFVEGKPKPATKFLEGSDIGLTENGYVNINSEFKTNVNNIWAIGDVTGKTETYDTALNHALDLLRIFTS